MEKLGLFLAVDVDTGSISNKLLLILPYLLLDLQEVVVVNWYTRRGRLQSNVASVAGSKLRDNPELKVLSRFYQVETGCKHFYTKWWQWYSGYSGERRSINSISLRFFSQWINATFSRGHRVVDYRNNCQEILIKANIENIEVLKKCISCSLYL